MLPIRWGSIRVKGSLALRIVTDCHRNQRFRDRSVTECHRLFGPLKEPSGKLNGRELPIHLKVEVLALPSSLHELILNKPELIEEFAAIRCLDPKDSQTLLLNLVLIGLADEPDRPNNHPSVS